MKNKEQIAESILKDIPFKHQEIIISIVNVIYGFCMFSIKFAVTYWIFLKVLDNLGEPKTFLIIFILLLISQQKQKPFLETRYL